MRIHFAQTFVPLDLVLIVTPDLFQDLIQFRVTVCIVLFFIPRDLVQRRFRQIHIAALDQFRHEPVEEGQKQSCDVCAVHVGIGHDDDLVIPELGDIEIFVDTGSERGDHGTDLGISQDPVQSCLFHVQDLTAERQDRLCFPDPCFLCASAGGISLDNKDLTVFRIFIRAVCQFSRKASARQRTLSCCFPCFPCGISCPLCQKGFFTDRPRDLRILLQIIGQLFPDNGIDGRSGLGVSEFLFSLALKLRVLDFNRNDRAQTFPDILSG